MPTEAITDASFYIAMAYLVATVAILGFFIWLVFERVRLRHLATALHEDKPGAGRDYGHQKK